MDAPHHQGADNFASSSYCCCCCCCCAPLPRPGNHGACLTTTLACSPQRVFLSVSCCVRVFVALVWVISPQEQKGTSTRVQAEHAAPPPPPPFPTDAVPLLAPAGGGWEEGFESVLQCVCVCMSMTRLQEILVENSCFTDCPPTSGGRSASPRRKPHTLESLSRDSPTSSQPTCTNALAHPLHRKDAFVCACV